MPVLSWGDVAALLTCGVLLYNAFRKRSKEDVRQIAASTAECDAQSASAYAEAAQTYAQQVVDLQTQLRTKEKEWAAERKTLEERLDAQDAKIAEVIRMDLIYKDWNKRLCAQIISLDATPVPMEPTKPRPKKGEQQ